MTLTWDGDASAVVVEAREVTDEGPSDDDDGDDDDDDTPDASEELDMLRVQLTVPAARGFIARAAQVIAAGRPPCPLCGQPLNAEGHICPRKNGYMH